MSPNICKELLELAAKAKGIDLNRSSMKFIALPAGGYLYGENCSWNPLFDGEDSLELAAHLGLLIDIVKHDNRVIVWDNEDKSETRKVFVSWGEEYFAKTATQAVKHAVLLSAASVGRNMT